jgi:hypothetical protein
MGYGFRVCVGLGFRVYGFSFFLESVGFFFVRGFRVLVFFLESVGFFFKRFRVRVLDFFFKGVGYFF